MTALTVNITDHALLRYLERQMQIPIDAVRKHMVKQAAGPAALGASSFKIDDIKFTFSLPRDGVVHVITVLERDAVSQHIKNPDDRLKHQRAVKKNHLLKMGKK